VIKIRYSDLPGGLHVRTTVQGRHTILYLLPGLTATQRRAALCRARSNARVGYGPRLPTAGVAVALTADRIRMTARNSIAAVRIHPVFFVPAAIVIASVTVAYLLMVSVSIQLRSPQPAGPGAQVGVRFGRATRSSLTGVPVSADQSASPVIVPSQFRAASAGRPTLRHSGRPYSGPGSPARSSPSASLSSSPRPTEPGPSPGPSSGRSPGPSPGLPSPSPSSTGLCLDLGPLGVCLKA
jgi:hypothetical protein